MAGRRRRWLCSGCALATSREEARTQSPSREGVAKGAKGEGGRYWRGEDGTAHTHRCMGGGDRVCDPLILLRCEDLCLSLEMHPQAALSTRPSHTFTPRPRRLHNTPPPRLSSTYPQANAVASLLPPQASQHAVRRGLCSAHCAGRQAPLGCGESGCAGRRGRGRGWSTGRGKPRGGVGG